MSTCQPESWIDLGFRSGNSSNNTQETIGFYMVLKFYYITSFDNISFKPSVGHLEQALGM